MNIPFDRTGLILYTMQYEACVAFYGQILGLPVMFTAEHLTCFDLGGTYLMVELSDEALAGQAEQERFRDRFCIRINVSDVKSMADQLKAAGVDVSYQEHSWGTVAKFRDPDGNLVAFKDSPGFERQVQQHPSP
ncbi:MAG: VOC family protein [Bacteroidota bacterium]